MKLSPVPPSAGAPKFSAANLLGFAQSLLTAVGLPDDRARDVAEVLLEGDLLGHTTHGLALLPLYLKALEENSMAKQGEPLVLADDESSLTWDGLICPVRGSCAGRSARRVNGWLRIPSSRLSFDKAITSVVCRRIFVR